jgi:hypothetical protein
VTSAKFAPITASLLAQKGDAAPSVVVPVTASPRAALVPRDDRPAPPELPPFVFPNPRQPDSAGKLRRIVVFIRPEELERLGIVAVKKGISRNDILRGALDDYFRKLSAEFSRPCACMEGGSPVAPLAT